jgi:hypothetical protein
MSGLPGLEVFYDGPGSLTFKMRISKRYACKLLKEAHEYITLKWLADPLNFKREESKFGTYFASKDVTKTKGIGSVHAKGNKCVWASWYIPWKGFEFMNVSDKWRGYEVTLRDDGELGYHIYRGAVPKYWRFE